MTALTDAIHGRHNPLASNPFRVAAAVSLFVHLVLIWGWLPEWRLPSFELPAWRDADDRLTVRLTPGPADPPAPAPPPALQARTRTAPPVIAPDRPAPASPPAAEPASARPPAVGDLSAYIEARRRSRIESAPAQGGAPETPAAENENTRASRLAAASLGPQRPITFGYDPSRSGGVFHIERMVFDHAEFTFAGWNRHARRYTKQTIEVRKDHHSDIRIAVVRRMIAIIREHEPGEFLWDSRRLGRSLTLSSRLRDNAGLEDFMMQEFFASAR